MTARHVVIFLALAFCLALSYANTPAEAATPAEPEVKECQKVSFAKLSNGGEIEVFLCEPEGALPFLLDSVGFMKDAE